MKTIHVTASSEYDVKIGAGLLDTLGSEVAKICKGSTVAIISDSNVWPLYGEKATSALLDAGFHPSTSSLRSFPSSRSIVSVSVSRSCKAFR